MRKCSIFLSGILLLAACEFQNSDKIEAKPRASDETINYPYTPKEKPNWEMGNPRHIAIVLNSLKNYELGKLDELHKYFADSVWFGDDGIEFNGTRDSLIKLLKKDRDHTQTVNIEMHDWEAVHGKDNKEDWVSIWYKAKWTTKDGKTD